MVLKYRTACNHLIGGLEPANYVDQWNFVDGIIGASIYYDKEIEATVAALEFESRPPMSIALHDEAYLLNESGHTIEKVRA